MSYLTCSELEKIGFKSIGRDARLSSRASFYNAGNIEIGDNVRIDDFCVLSAGPGGIKIANNVHIAVFSSLIGRDTILLSEFCNLSSRVSIYSSNDDYSGTTMTNPTIPEAFTGVAHAPVFLRKHVIVGSGSVILPGVTLDEGVAIGALSLVKDNCHPFGIYAGCPARFIRERKRDLLTLEETFRQTLE
ncbi:MAG: acyltransferase [Betaproteobacteria bacterium]|nr:acyltransferase [Betaproteobacteria bacterium]